MTKLTERELLIAHTIKIENLRKVTEGIRDDLSKHYEKLGGNCKWFVGLVTVGVLCFTGYVNTLNDRIAKNTQEIAIHMKDIK